MLNISEELKAAFLTDSTHKNIQIHFEGETEPYKEINFFTEGNNKSLSGSNKRIESNFTIYQFAASDPVNECFKKVPYFCISGIFAVETFVYNDIPTPEYMGIGLSVYDNNGTAQTVEFEPVAFEITQQLDGPSFQVTLDTSLYSRVAGIYIYIRKAGGAHYEADQRASSYEVSMSSTLMCLGNDLDLLPFQNTTSINWMNQHSENWHDYVITVVSPNPVTNDYLCQNAFSLSEHICSSNILKFGASEGAQLSFDSVGIDNDDLVGRYFTASIGCEGIQERVPLGRFRVKNVTKEGSYNIVKKHIEAYDGMYPLSMDATDWFNKNIGIYEDVIYWANDSAAHVVVSRQPFSTLCSAFRSLNINPDITNIQTQTGYLTNIPVLPGDPTEVATRFLKNYGTNQDDCVQWASLASEPDGLFFDHIDPNKVFKVDTNYDYRTAIFNNFEEGITYGVDTFGMYPDAGGLLIQCCDAGGILIHAFCCDMGEWFAVPPETDGIIIGIPTRYHMYLTRGDGTLRLDDFYVDWPSTMTVSSGEFKYMSPNWAVPMVYYNWMTKESAHPTNITFRDVIRSLVEPTGTFLRYGRNGKIEFVETSQLGLYPTETLYPASDLYPRRAGGGNQYVSRARYKSFKCDDSATSNYGKLQIIASDLKTYIGNADKPNTYVMDDNIFYCDSVVTYAMNVDGTESLPQVVEMLTNLYDKISIVKYTPCEVDMVGMPWVECGDRLKLLTDSYGFETFVFNRVLSGIQVLDDSVEALGETETEQIVDLWR